MFVLAPITQAGIIKFVHQSNSLLLYEQEIPDQFFGNQIVHFFKFLPMGFLNSTKVGPFHEIPPTRKILVKLIIKLHSKTNVSSKLLIRIDFGILNRI